MTSDKRGCWKVVNALVGTRMFYKAYGAPWEPVEVVEGNCSIPGAFSLGIQRPNGEIKYIYGGVKGNQSSRGKEWVMSTTNGTIRERRPEYDDTGLGHMAVQVHAQGPLDRNRFQASVLKPSSKRHKNQTGEDVVVMANGGFATPQEAHLWLSTWARQHPEATDFIIYDRKASRMVYAHTTRRGRGRAIPRGSFQGLGCASCGSVAGLGAWGEPNTTVSHGTMNPTHLIPRLMAELGRLWPEQADVYRKNFAAVIRDPDHYPEGADDLVERLFVALGKKAPSGYYFGAHPGDGSDYGFWAYDDD